MMTPGPCHTSCVLLALLLVTRVPVLPADSSSCDTAECEGARRENIWTQQQEQEQEQQQEGQWQQDQQDQEQEHHQQKEQQQQEQ